MRTESDVNSQKNSASVQIRVLQAFQSGIVIKSKESNVVIESLLLFRRAPGFANQSIDVGSKLRASVVEAKERIIHDLL